MRCETVVRKKKPKALREPQWKSSVLPPNHLHYLEGKSTSTIFRELKQEKLGACLRLESNPVSFFEFRFDSIRRSLPSYKTCSVSEAPLFELMAKVIKCCLKQDGVVATIHHVEDVILVSHLRFLDVANWSLWDTMSLMFPLRKNGYEYIYLFHLEINNHKSHCVCDIEQREKE